VTRLSKINAELNSSTKNDEDDARKAWLQHYSSKSSMQATLLLSLAIAFFTFVQAVKYDQTTTVKILYSVVMPATLLVGLRAIGRLFNYGWHADAILRDEKANHGEMQQSIGNDQEMDRIAIMSTEKKKGKSRQQIRFNTGNLFALARAANVDVDYSCRCVRWKRMLSWITEFNNCCIFALIFFICLICFYFSLADILLVIFCAVMFGIIWCYIGLCCQHRGDYEEYSRIPYIPTSLVCEFNEIVAINHHPPGVSVAIADLMREAIKKKKQEMQLQPK